MARDQQDYFTETHSQHLVNETHESTDLRDKDLVRVVEKSNCIFQPLKRIRFFIEKTKVFYL